MCPEKFFGKGNIWKAQIIML